MNVAGPVRASRHIDGGNNGKLRNSSHGGEDAAGGVDMYLDIPSFELSLDEFEEYALARLKVSISSSSFSLFVCLFVCLLHSSISSLYRSCCCHAVVDDGVNHLHTERRCYGKNRLYIRRMSFI